MKIYETKNNTSARDFRLGNHPRDNTLLFEAPDRLYINGMGHDKDTLAPIFGSTFQVFANTADWFKLTNSLTSGHDPESNDSSLISTHYVGSKTSGDYLNTNNRQSIMAGVSMTSLWRSSFDSNKIYFTTPDPDGDRNWAARYDIAHAHLDGFVSSQLNNGSNSRGSTCFFHEDNNYLYGILNGRSFDTGSNAHERNSKSCFIRMDKSTLEMTASGYRPYYDGITVILHVTSDYFIFYCTDSVGAARYTGNEDGTSTGTTLQPPQAGFGLIRFSDDWTSTTLQQDMEHKGNGQTPTWNNPFLTILDEQGNERYDDHHGTLIMVPINETLRNDPTLITHSTTLLNSLSIHGDTAGDFYDGSNTDHYLTVPAIVSDSSLKSTHKIVRTYTSVRTVDGDYHIIRNNIPMPDNSNAFQSAASHPGSNPYGSSTNPAMDQRKCTITSDSNLLPTSFNDTNIVGDSGLFFEVTSESVSQRVHNMSFFMDSNNNAYLMLDFAHPQVHRYTTYAAFHSIWVFKIIDHASSLTNDPAETDSLNLKVIQEIQIDRECYGLYRPTDDPKIFYAMSISAAEHPVYNWNPTTEQFTTSYSINGNICAIGNDSNGNVYSAHKGTYGRYEIHAESTVLPNEITVVPAQTRYEYTGTTISSTVSVDAYNYLGNRIAATINLQILGSGVEFTDPSATNNGKTISVTTSASASTAVNIDITSSSFVRITASMSV